MYSHWHLLILLVKWYVTTTGAFASKLELKPEFCFPSDLKTCGFAPSKHLVHTTPTECIKNVEPYHCSITQDRKEASIHHKLKSVFGRWESHSLINYHKLNVMLHLFVCINDGFVAQTCLNLFLNLSNKCSRGLFIELKFYHPTALHSPKQHQQILYIIKFSIKRAWICINNHNYCPNQTTIFTTIS